MTQNEKKNHGSEDFTSSRPFVLQPLAFFMRGRGHTLCGATPTGGDKERPWKTRTRTVKGREKTDMSWCITYEIYFICACTCGVCVCVWVYNIYIYIYVCVYVCAEFWPIVAIRQNLGADTWRTLNKGLIVPNRLERGTFLLGGYLRTHRKTLRHTLPPRASFCPHPREWEPSGRVKGRESNNNLSNYTTEGGIRKMEEWREESCKWEGAQLGHW